MQLPHERLDILEQRCEEIGRNLYDINERCNRMERLLGTITENLPELIDGSIRDIIGLAPLRRLNSEWED
jgi:hypothetical protein